MEAHVPSTSPCESGPSTAPGPRRLRIGVVLDDMDGEYHDPLLDGVCHMAERLGIDLIFTSGRSPGTPLQFEQQFGRSSRRRASTPPTAC